MSGRSPKLRSFLKELIRRAETGTDSTEYALLAAIIAVTLILGATFLGGKINQMFGNTSAQATATAGR